jgi:HEAT repeat protein
MNRNAAWSLIALACASSPLLAAQETSSDRDTDIALRQRHYAAVEQELAQHCDGAATTEQLTARARMLEVLGAYRVRGDFGCVGETASAFVPRFVDAQGRRCAVAELLHASGRDDLVLEVASTNNDAWVLDLGCNDSFLDWLGDNGLTLEEAARIQAPPTHINRPPPPEYKGPTSERATTSGSSDSGRSTGARTSSGGTVSNGPTTSTGAALPPTVALESLAPEGAWWMWWESNKAQFLRPNRLELDGVHGDDAGRTFASQIDFVRHVMEPSIVRALASPDARMRGAAAIALGRTARAAAVERLIPLLRDSQLVVREQALLGLGATGAPAASDVLLAIARDGRIDKSSPEFGLAERTHAIVGLGIGRRVGFEPSVDAEIVRIVGARRGPQREALGVAAMLYATLTPSDELDSLALQLARSDSEPVAVRCRAIESLRSANDAATLSALQHLLSGGRIELRRSAALALGESTNALVVPALQTAYELESDPLTRGFLLLSLGRQGGESAREFVQKSFDEDRGAMKPWAALALGVMAHESRDPLIARSVVRAVAAERNAQSRGAYWLAAGLARDFEAVPALTKALSSSADAVERSYAALGLAMIGGDTAHGALTAQLASDKSSMTRSQIGIGLGVLGAPGDADRLGEVLRQVSEPDLQVQVTGAIAFHGSSEALHELGTLALDDGLGSATRAAVLDGLGMLVGTGDALTLLELARSANFALFDETQMSLLATTL